MGRSPATSDWEADGSGTQVEVHKVHFARAELEYLGHVITHDGLKIHPRLVKAVHEFPTPQNIHDVH